MDTLGARIRRARLSAGLTLRDLARGANVSETTLRNWEDDKNPPRPDLAARLQDQLGVDLGLGPTTSVTDLRPVPDDPARPVPTRGKRQTVPRLNDATTPQILAELHSRDARATDQLREARRTIAELQAELARRPGFPDLTDVDRHDSRRFAARHDDDPPDPSRGPR